MRRLVICAILISAAFMARTSSTGKALLDISREYVGALSSGNTEDAYFLLSDSLAALVSPVFLELLDNSPSSGRITIGSIESRGYTISIALDHGGSRTIWLGENDSGKWEIAGDSSLDNLLGRATVMCTAFAQETVIPAYRNGVDPGEYSCPISSKPYFLEGSMLLCPSGHLGDGLDVGGSSCMLLRDSLAGVVSDYILAGYRFPDSFAGMFEESDGEFSQRGGFRCPDNGYVYYEITGEGVFCPFHDETSRIELQSASERSYLNSASNNPGQENL
ncbi:MAG: hypothetical protein K8R76_08770 [Candidatus Aegiribacteria sp.]|nr:hypothetical protein [Candidatus Aegiribacteria sp.]